MLQHSVRVLDSVVVAAGSDGEVPEYVNSLAEWREMCGICKSAIKYILGEVASALKTECLPAVWRVAEAAQAKLKATEQAGASDAEQVSAAGHALDVRLCSKALLYYALSRTVFRFLAKVAVQAARCQAVPTRACNESMCF